jgi:hypothetical protein
MRALAVALVLLVAAGCRSAPVDVRDLPFRASGSWIVVGGPQHPLAADPGVELFAVGGPRARIVAVLLDAIEAAPGVRPVAYLERELEFVEERDHPGIGTERTLLHAVLHGVEVRQLPLEEVLLRIEEAGRRTASP